MLKYNLGNVGPLLKFSAFLLLGLLQLMPGSHASAEEMLDIEFTDDDTFLPYHLDATVEVGWEDRPNIRRPVQFVQLHGAHGDSTLIMMACNARNAEDESSGVSFIDYCTRLTVMDKPIWGRISDLTSYRESSSLDKRIAVTFCRNDSAFIMEYSPIAGTDDVVFLTNGEDRTDDGHWWAKVWIHAIEDYDLDGKMELFVQVFAARDKTPRALFCVETSPFRIEWQLNLASAIARNYGFICIKDNKGPRVVFTTYGPSNNVSDANFNDSFGYLTSVDRSGAILYNKVIANDLRTPMVRPVPDCDSLFLLYHVLDVSDKAGVPHASKAVPRLSLVRKDGSVVKTILLEEFLRGMWTYELPESGESHFVALWGGAIGEYDTSLRLLRCSNRSELEFYVGQLQLPETDELAFAVSARRSIALYTLDWEQLAVLNGANQGYLFTNQQSDSTADGCFIISDPSFTLACLRKKTSFEYVKLFYWRYKIWFVMALASLIVALAVSTVYRRQTAQNLQLISRQKSELQRTHQKLKEAQARIISQEKYRQARDIAGGFAHEIRNALFPADGAHNLLLSASKEECVLSEKVRKLVKKASRATSRAVSLTDEVLKYARIETLHDPAPVRFADVLNQALMEHEETISSLSVETSIIGDADVFVLSNPDQLRTIIDNILRNSFNALTEADKPHILIEISSSDQHVDVTFSDNGRGIDPDDLPRVFDTFFSTRPNEGNGLGLAFVKRLVELYDGTVSARRKRDKGTAIELTFVRATDRMIKN